MIDCTEQMRAMLESDLPPVRAMLAQTWELNVVTESSGYRGTPTKLIDELLAELTTDNLVALVRQTELPIDKAASALLARVRGRLSSANVPKDVLAKFDDFVFCVVSFAEVLQDEEVAQGLRPHRAQRHHAPSPGPGYTLGESLVELWKDPGGRAAYVLAVLGLVAGLEGGNLPFWFWILAVVLVGAWATPFILERRRR